MYRLHGWRMSYYTGKIFCYLKYKNLPFELVRPSALMLLNTKLKYGDAVMPVLETPEGKWLQDTSHIIDVLEDSHPNPQISPSRNAVPSFAAYILEIWGDEWWTSAAMYSRWSHVENYPDFRTEAGDNLLPYFPRTIKNYSADIVAKKLRRMLYAVGVRSNQKSTIDDWLVSTIGFLDKHFESFPYLLGDVPSIGDFSLAGPFYGHIDYDSNSKRVYMRDKNHLSSWLKNISEENGKEDCIDTMYNHEQTINTQKQSFDKFGIPLTLKPIIESATSELLPFLKATNLQLKLKLEQYPKGKLLPRALADVNACLNGVEFHRKATPYSIWMLLRLQRIYSEMPDKGKNEIRLWLNEIDGIEFIDMDLPNLDRKGLNVVSI